ncbi:MAG: T9SS type A sorting domain-containing protein, partial [Bacteroidota bacterium]
ESFSPSAYVSGMTVHVVWYDTRDGNAEIYYKRSPDGGLSWGADTRLTNNGFGSYHPSVTSSGTNVHLTWYDERDGNREIYYKSSSDAGLSWGADTRLTTNIAESSHPVPAVSGQAVHIVWQDIRDGNWEIHYKRNPSGNSTGIADNSNNAPGQTGIYPNPNNGTFYFITDKIIQPGKINGTLYNSSGKIIFQKELNVNDCIKISNADARMYFLRITSDNYTVMKKVLILK